MSNPKGYGAPGMRVGFGDGMTNALFRSMIDDGVDVSDPRAIERWIERFNKLPYEERVRRTERRPMLLPQRPAPTMDELRRSVEASPFVAHLRHLRTYFEKGRKLTATGNLTLADARNLVEALGTDDQLEDRIGDRVYKVRTSIDLPGLNAIIELATECGAVRNRQGKCWAVKSWFQAFDKDVVAAAASWTDLAFRFGFARLRHIWGYGSDPILDYVDAVQLHLLGQPYFAGEAISRDELLNALTANYDNYAEKSSIRHDSSVKKQLGRLLDDLVWTARRCGLVDAEGAVPSGGAVGAHLWTFSTLQLTPLGYQVVGKRMAADDLYDEG